MARKIKVGILDDHLSTVNGYRYSLEQDLLQIKVSWSAGYYIEATKKLKKQKIDVLILDASVPISTENNAQYPIFNAISKIKDEYAKTKILVISMHDSKAFITNLAKVGIDGYILKNDTDSIENLAEIIHFIHNDGAYFSPLAEAFIKEYYDPDDHDHQLTPRQIEYLSYFNAYPNMTSDDVAEKLDIAPSTLRNTLTNIYVRLRVNKLPAALIKARKLGLITPDEPSLPS